MAEFDLVGIVVKDMPGALGFYRLLGLDIPAEADAEGHVEYRTKGGFRLAWDTIEIVQSFNDEWPQPTGHRMGMAFLCQDAAEVDRLHAQVVAAGYSSHKEPLGCILGPALCGGRRSGWQFGRSLRQLGGRMTVRNIEVMAEASSIEKWRKQVIAGQRDGPRFAFLSGEGTYMPGGEGTAPTPLTYYVAGMAL